MFPVDVQQLREWGRDHLWMQGERAVDLQANDGYHIVVRGEGCYIYDIDGTRLIDGNSSGFAKSIGHGRREIAEAVGAQLVQLSHTPNSFGHVTVPGIQLARKLAELAPGSLDRTFFTTGGSEAVEIAIQIARQVQYIRGHTRKFKIISRRPEYHGSTYATMSLGMRTDRNHGLFEPLMSGVLQVDAPHCHRCPWGYRDRTPDDCCGQSLTSLQHTIEAEGAASIAALVATPLRVGGSLPPKDYWPQVWRLCVDKDILLIADEVTLGGGRLGAWLGLERFGVVPDIVALGKGLTSGELPVGATMATREIAQTFDAAPRVLGQFHHGATFGAHPVVMAAALANIRIIESEDLINNANAMGSHLYERLLELHDRHPSVEYVSGGIGLLASISVVRKRSTGERYRGGAEGPALTRLAESIRAKGLSLRVSNTINIAPPLTVTRPLIEEIVDILEHAFAEMEREFPPEA
jgi:adenosylmethionine-8-amino-7-oxononanoate aminotransferase